MPNPGASSRASRVWYLPLIDLCPSIRAAVSIEEVILRCGDSVSAGVDDVAVTMKTSSRQLKGTHPSPMKRITFLAHAFSARGLTVHLAIVFMPPLYENLRAGHQLKALRLQSPSSTWGPEV